jgi:ferredoxin-type protein NapF
MTSVLSRRQFLIGADAAGEQSSMLPRIGPSCLPALGIHCRTCGDACPEDAIAFRPRVGMPPEPWISSDLCTSCGGCAEACPVGAIAITGQDCHQHA